MLCRKCNDLKHFSMCTVCKPNLCKCVCSCREVPTCDTPKPVVVSPRVSISDILASIDSKCSEEKCTEIDNKIETLGQDVNDAVESSKRCEENCTEIGDKIETLEQDVKDVKDAVENDVDLVEEAIIAKAKARAQEICAASSSVCSVDEDAESALARRYAQLLADHACGEKLLFTSCEDLDAYKGTDTCPLEDGLFAVVQGEDGCFKLYAGKWVDKSVIGLEGEACDTFRYGGTGEVEVYKWSEYTYCNRPEIELGIDDVVDEDMDVQYTASDDAGQLIKEYDVPAGIYNVTVSVWADSPHEDLSIWALTDNSDTSRPPHYGTAGQAREDSQNTPLANDLLIQTQGTFNKLMSSTGKIYVYGSSDPSSGTQLGHVQVAFQRLVVNYS